MFFQGALDHWFDPPVQPVTTNFITPTRDDEPCGIVIRLKSGGYYIMEQPEDE